MADGQCQENILNIKRLVASLYRNYINICTGLDIFCEMCLAALWDERKLIQVEFAIFRVATFLPISINLWQQKYKDLNCGMCGGIAKSCDPLWYTSLTEKYKSLQNPVLCCNPQRWVLWVSVLLIVTLFLVGPAGTPCFGLWYAVVQNCSQWPMVWSG